MNYAIIDGNGGPTIQAGPYGSWLKMAGTAGKCPKEKYEQT